MSSTSHVLCQHHFYQDNIEQLSNTSILIAYSGGLDSHVLLHFFSQLRESYPDLPLRSVYVDHGLQSISSQWGKHCKKVAKSLQISHQTLTLSLDSQSGESLEALARTGRYAALKNHLLANEVLITAHHQEDQAETLLLQLFRGAGVDGLAAMPILGHSMDFTHWRPLLAYSQQSLRNYAEQYQLNFIEDPSNQEQRFDRNYIRHHLIPTLQERWPSIVNTLSRSASIQADASHLISDCMTQQLSLILNNKDNTLSVEKLKKKSIVQQKALLRLWIKQSGFLAPSAKKLQHIISDAVNSRYDSNPSVEWGQGNIRRYRNDLYILIRPIAIPHDYTVIWDLSSDLTLDYGLETLRLKDLGELKSILLNNNITVTVRLRRGGERIQPKGHVQSKALKKILHEQSIPPWIRDRILLVYANETLIYVHNIATINPTNLMDNL
ncbi:MAG: tRNA lysidine(34) synthetase TilS [Thiotrichaceae bacterium]|nr:tRNA lysidine(34) synthetase TilS [Thiotrichaceae bacterium]